VPQTRRPGTIASRCRRSAPAWSAPAVVSSAPTRGRTGASDQSGQASRGAMAMTGPRRIGAVQRRALAMLAYARRGYTRSALLTNGFPSEVLTSLVRGGPRHHLFSRQLPR
jgi:hypothetical protein